MALLLNVISLSLMGLWFHLGFIILTNYINDVPVTVTGQLFLMGSFIAVILLAGFLWEMAGKIRKEQKAGNPVSMKDAVSSTVDMYGELSRQKRSTASIVGDTVIAIIGSILVVAFVMHKEFGFFDKFLN